MAANGGQRRPMWRKGQPQEGCHHLCQHVKLECLGKLVIQPVVIDLSLDLAIGQSQQFANRIFVLVRTRIPIGQH